LEYWSDRVKGFWEMGNWDIEKLLFIVKSLRDCFSLRINISIFQHSLAQTWFAWTQFYTFGPPNITLAAQCSGQVAPGQAITPCARHKYQALLNLNTFNKV
jgi:hypothetical protein